MDTGSTPTSRKESFHSGFIVSIVRVATNQCVKDKKHEAIAHVLACAPQVWPLGLHFASVPSSNHYPMATFMKRMNHNNQLTVTVVFS